MERNNRCGEILEPSAIRTKAICVFVWLKEIGIYYMNNNEQKTK